MVRRGRPRKPGPREANGQPQRLPKRQRRDRGTNEIQSLRQWWAGTGDPVLASYPLGILLANQVITEPQHVAGCDYAWLHWAVFGRASLAAVSLEFMDHGRAVEIDRAKEERRLEAVHGQFRRLRRLRGLLDNLVIFERIPRWMRPVDPRLGDVTDARLFIEAMEMLRNPT